MRIETSVDLSATPEEVFVARATEEFQVAKCVASGALSHEASVVDHGGRTLISTRRDMPTKDFPDAAKSLVGDTLVVVEMQDWGPPEVDGSRRAAVDLRIDGTPVSLKGVLALMPNGEGTLQTLSADLKASIPFVGGKIEKMAAPAIKAGFDIETRLLSKRLG